MTNVVVNKPRKGPKVFTIVMSMVDLVWLGVGAALALTVFFVFGLLVGRGYFPADDTMGGALPPQAEQTAMHAQDEAPAEPEVLRPEELTYPDKLSPSSKPKPKPAAEAGPAADGQGADQTGDQASDQTSDQAAEGQSTDQAAPDQATADQAAEVDPNEPVFHYIYQVAAFKDIAMAQDLADKLTAKGLTAEVKTGENKGVTWHRVRVLFTGTPPATRELRDMVHEITKVKPVLVSKKPVE